MTSKGREKEMCAGNSKREDTNGQGKEHDSGTKLNQIILWPLLGERNGHEQTIIRIK